MRPRIRSVIKRCEIHRRTAVRRAVVQRQHHAIGHCGSGEINLRLAPGGNRAQAILNLQRMVIAIAGLAGHLHRAEVQAFERPQFGRQRL